MRPGNGGARDVLLSRKDFTNGGPAVHLQGTEAIDPGVTEERLPTRYGSRFFWTKRQMEYSWSGWMIVDSEEEA
ncbi:MAG TPA: hypothetical protein VFC63_27110 [Blastocatellia bacterium]|nr:hypothetical protein [Blastocatellia bacterium]